MIDFIHAEACRSQQIIGFSNVTKFQKTTKRKTFFIVTTAITKVYPFIFGEN